MVNVATSKILDRMAQPSIKRASSNGSWSFRSIPSTPSTNSTAFWRTPPKREDIYLWGWIPRSKSWSHHQGLSKRKITGLLAFMILTVLYFNPLHRNSNVQFAEMDRSGSYHHAIRPLIPSPEQGDSDPIRWLAENSNHRHAIYNSHMQFLSGIGGHGRPRAALISLVRNSELEGIMQSMRQLEYRWNRKYQYPWIFFNDEPFTDEFKARTTNSTSAKCYYELVPKEHWAIPVWIDQDRFNNGLEYLGTIGVGKGWMVSYHHMCRWNSGFFYKHPFLKDYDWYWRVEPDVHYYCDIDYDVFRFMRDNNMKYGFNMNILDDARSFPSLWSRTKEFVAAYPKLIHPQANMDWLLDPKAEREYNNCQFFSNFEIGSLAFWRGEANEAYFDWLDQSGGFYYERFGDAPVHTLSVSMFVPKKEIWYFGDVGYQHDINHHCPPKSEDVCDCEPSKLDANFYKLVPELSPQRKPEDTCLRLWLGGGWLEKRDGWTREGEKAFGGDGYHGYKLDG